MRTFGYPTRAVTLPVAALCFALAACNRPAPVPPAVVRLATPAESTLKDDAFSRSVRRGRAILAATHDSLPHNVGNGLRCNSCHMDEGTRAFAMPYVGVYARYPQYRSRSAAVELIEDRVNDCFLRSMNGTEIARDGHDMHDIVAYLAWVSRGVAVGARVKGQGIDSILPVSVPDTAHGAAVYVAQCARCHGAKGEGMMVPTIAGLYAPPVWGDQSYNIGAGMARLRVTGAFVKHNMPYDQPGTLTPQQAFDVAGYVDAQPRPDYAAKEEDWPKGNPPADVAYKIKAEKAKH